MRKKAILDLVSNGINNSWSCSHLFRPQEMDDGESGGGSSKLFHQWPSRDASFNQDRRSTSLIAGNLSKFWFPLVLPSKFL